jgi:hypothetical protein
MNLDELVGLRVRQIGRIPICQNVSWRAFVKEWWTDEGNVLEVVAIVAISLNDPMLDRHSTAETDSAVTKHLKEWTVSALCAMLHRTSPG